MNQVEVKRTMAQLENLLLSNPRKGLEMVKICKSMLSLKPKTRMFISSGHHFMF